MSFPVDCADGFHAVEIGQIFFDYSVADFLVGEHVFDNEIVIKKIIFGGFVIVQDNARAGDFQTVFIAAEVVF